MYGYCDAQYKKGMSRNDCIEFVKKGKRIDIRWHRRGCYFSCALLYSCGDLSALAHAMARDGSSGGVIRLAIIDEHGVERRMYKETEFLKATDLV